MIETKECPRCRELKPLREFRKDKRKASGYGSHCLMCVRESNLRYAKGLTKEAYDDLYRKQGGMCAICGTTNPRGSGVFPVDHDHSCCPGRVTCGGACIRGLLCHWCNHNLGWYEKHQEAVAAYLDAA